MLQNKILKEKTTELLEKNDDLNEVVSELSKYYVHIKKASEKTQELNEYLTDPDDTIEERIKKNNKKSSEEKKFF
jgi:predicted transcriptional regulator